MPLLWLFAAVQIVFALRVLVRMLRTANGRRLTAEPTLTTRPGTISVIVPVLDEFGRLGPCLERLVACGPEIREIIVVDGGSVDGTPNIIASFAESDRRVRALVAPPPPADWNGKAWQLDYGLRASSPDATWIVTIDADVRVRPALLRSLVPWARRERVDALSIATKQDLADLGSGLLHPALLTTLVYRYGLPGKAARTAAAVQANGQCFAAERHLLVSTDAFAHARASLCEDVAVARALVRAGAQVGFYEAGDLATVRMYDSAAEMWRNWPRSLTLRDPAMPRHAALGLAEVALVQAAPLVVLVCLGLNGVASEQRAFAFETNAVLLLVRVAVLAGTYRAYRNPPWTYWLSLFADTPVAAALFASALRRRHHWRGRALVVPERIT